MENAAGEVPAALLRWVMPDESASEFFRRQGREVVSTGLPFIDAHIKLRPGLILELAGPAGAAKSEMLLQMVAHLLCSTRNVQQEQEQEHVVLVDCDGKFDMLRLLQLLEHRIPGASSSVLPRLHVVRCFNTLELLLALNALPQQLTALKASLQGRCRLLLLDNIAANVWLDKAAVFSAANQQLPYTPRQHTSWPPAGAGQQQWASTGAMQPPPAPYQQGPYGSAVGAERPQDPHSPGFDALRVQTALAALLQAISQQWRVPVVVTKQTGVHLLDRPGTAKLVQREVLTEPLQTAMSHRLVLMPAAASQAHQQAAQGEQGAVVLAQWQAADFTGPLQRCLIRSDGVHLLA